MNTQNNERTPDAHAYALIIPSPPPQAKTPVKSRLVKHSPPRPCECCGTPMADLTVLRTAQSGANFCERLAAGVAIQREASA